MPSIKNSKDPGEIKLHIESLQRRHELIKKEVDKRNRQGRAAEPQTIHLKKTKLSLKDSIEFWKQTILLLETNSTQ